jgi:hypothetical protein
MTHDPQRVVRIGAGAGYSGDRIEPAAELAEQGQLDYLIFECLAERTIAIGQQARLADPTTGYDPLLAERMHAVLKTCADQGVRIITNMGAANPQAAARRIREIARELGLTQLKVAAVIGDDVLEAVQAGDFRIEDNGQPVASWGAPHLGQCLPGRGPHPGSPASRRRRDRHRPGGRSGTGAGAIGARIRLGRR